MPLGLRLEEVEVDNVGTVIQAAVQVVSMLDISSWSKKTVVFTRQLFFFLC